MPIIHIAHACGMLKKTTGITEGLLKLNYSPCIIDLLNGSRGKGAVRRVFTSLNVEGRLFRARRPAVAGAHMVNGDRRMMQLSFRARGRYLGRRARRGLLSTIGHTLPRISVIIVSSCNGKMYGSAMYRRIVSTSTERKGGIVVSPGKAG